MVYLVVGGSRTDCTESTTPSVGSFTKYVYLAESGVFSDILNKIKVGYTSTLCSSGSFPLIARVQCTVIATSTLISGPSDHVLRRTDVRS